MTTPAGPRAPRRLFPSLAIAASVLLASALGAALRSSARAQTPGAPASPAHPIAETVLDLNGLGAGWHDIGWASHTLPKGAPAQVDFSDRGGWIFSHSEFDKPFGGLLIRYRAPAAHGEFLEVRLDGRPGQSFPRVAVGGHNLRALEGGESEAFIDGAQLDPLGLPFSQVVLQANKRVDSAPVAISLIGLTARGSPGSQVAPAALAAIALESQLDCAQTHPINPFIYGAGLGGKDDRWETGVTARRWGGNTTSTYNWELGNAWNVGRDWFFRNVPVAPGAAQFIDEGMAHKTPTALTVPILGAVAKDTHSCSYPVSVFGPQQQSAPEDKDCGNGVGKDGKPIAGSAAATVPAPPELIERWVRALRLADHKRGARAVRGYILDNEPMLWSVNHRDVHPAAVTYDELLDRTVRYAGAIRRADPDAVIAGPALWGWSAYFYSAADGATGRLFIPKDRLLHGGKALLPWWLEQVRAREKKDGVRLIDVVDVHYYPQAEGIGIYTGGATDPETSARRIRSVRSLWDPTYSDESWIGEPIQLIPRLRGWIDENAPGLGISIGEWNFGAENHISGGLAVAEALGRFGNAGITSAYYWAFPPHASPADWAFRAYRNYDGAGAQFGATSIEVKSAGQPLASLFASRAEDNRIVSVILNEDFQNPLLARVEGGSCGALTVKRVFSYTGGEKGPSEVKSLEEPGAPLVFPPASINVVEYAVKR